MDKKVARQTIVASLLSLAVGLGAGMYAMAPDATISIATSPLPVMRTALAEAKTEHPCLLQSASGPHEFTQDWFTTEDRLAAWNRHLKPLAGTPLAYLEVGVFEGRSMLWMLENVLTHPESRAVGIDIELFDNYLRNLVRSGKCASVQNLRGPSQDLLHTLPKKAFDLIYIDGSHLGRDVLVDAVLAFERLKVGGLMVFDDYQWFTDWAPEIRPGPAIDAFVTQYRHELEIVHRGYQMIVRRREHPCAFNPERYTPIGQYCYQWVSGSLVRQKDQGAVQISEGERDVIRKILASLEPGRVDPPIEKFRDRPEFRAMNERLSIFP